MSKQIGQCPRCGVYGKHITQGHDPACYRWTQHDSALFEEISGRDLAARMTSKKYAECNHAFKNIELNLDVFQALAQDTKIQRTQVGCLEKAWNRLLVEHKAHSPAISPTEIARNSQVMYELPGRLNTQAVAACLNEALGDREFFTGDTGKTVRIWLNLDTILRNTWEKPHAVSAA